MSWKSWLIVLCALLWVVSIFSSGLLVVLVGAAISAMVIWLFYHHKKKIGDDKARTEQFTTKFAMVFGIVSAIMIFWFFVELIAAPTETLAMECLVCYGDGCTFCKEMGWIMGTQSDVNPGVFRSLFVAGCSAIIAFIAYCDSPEDDSQ